MKKLIPFLMIVMVLSLSGCRLSASQSNQVAEPTLSDVQVQTQISTLLTAQPTATEAAKENASATPALPTPGAAVPTATSATKEISVASSATPTSTAAAAQPTATQAASVLKVSPTVTATNAPAATQGPTPTLSKDDPKSHQGAVTSTDPMNNSTKWVWPTGTNEFTSIDFSGGALKLKSLKAMTGWRLANPAGQALGDLYLEASIKTGTCAADDQYGVIARIPVLKDADQGYLFGFTCDGRFSIRMWDGKIGVKGQMTRLIDWKANKAINAGSNQTNRLGILMIGGRMALYANGVLLGEVTNTTFGSGYFGLFIGGISTPNFNIDVDEMSYWENPKP